MGVIDLGKRISAIEKELEGGAGGEVIDQLEAAVTALEEAAVPTKTAVTTLLNGCTAYADAGGVYYETMGSLVHVHLSVYDANGVSKSVKVFELPEGVRPATQIEVIGGGDETFANATKQARLKISPDGSVYKFSNGAYGIGDLFFMITPTT